MDDADDGHGDGNLFLCDVVDALAVICTDASLDHCLCAAFLLFHHNLTC